MMRVEALLLACCALTGVVSAPDGSASQALVSSPDGAGKEPVYTVPDPAVNGLLSSLSVSAAPGAHPAPPYVESLELLTRNGNALLELLPQTALPVTDPRRHYVLIAGVLACVVEYLNSDCTPPDYEHEFLPVVDILLPVVWQDPSSAVAKLEKFVEDTKDIVQHIQDMVDLHCQGLRPAVCNMVIEAIASQSEEDDEALELLLLVGELSQIYEENRYSDEAANFNSVSLLLNGQEKLKPLVKKGAQVYKKLYGIHCEP